MPFELYADVILTRDVSERGLRVGDVGTLVEQHVVPGTAEEGYSFGSEGQRHTLGCLPRALQRGSLALLWKSRPP